MKIETIQIQNFRGISSAKVFFNGHSVLIGDNNAGKSTIFEAIDLVLGPDRVSRTPVVDEHDFFNGLYYDKATESLTKIEINVIISDLGQEQISRFANNLQFWDNEEQRLLNEQEINKTDEEGIKKALSIKFIGNYNIEDDDFEGQTFFAWPIKEDGTLQKFTKSDKRECGFLYLRALRTGSRALSMERGSLLDIILQIKEIRPQMWEHVLEQLKRTDVAKDPKLGLSGVLKGVQEALNEFVPSDWGTEPQLRVSDLTREHLRRTLTVFMSTGRNSYQAPFHHQGTGTINTMVLALLSMIAEEKQNVIFAMEEPEIAIPPYTQKRIIHSIINKSSQALFTSHSPFVLEEFPPNKIISIRRDEEGAITGQSVTFPSSIKSKNYNSEFRLRFAESLLAKRVLITEGATEASSYPAAGRRLNELAPKKFSSLEALGVAVFDAHSETAVAEFGAYFKNLGKLVFAVFDKQDPEALKKIKANVDYAFESKYKGFEELILQETSEDIIIEFYKTIIKEDGWPEHLKKKKAADEDDIDDVITSLKEYLKWTKGAKSASEMIGICKKSVDIPETLRTVLQEIKKYIES
jgi:putative ATP-dependent endonuclease of OLD family